MSCSMDCGSGFTRESLAIEVDGSLGGQRVVEVLARLALGGRKPKTLSIDNGPEFTSKRLDQWAYLNGVELDFSRPGKPTDNAMIEAFNARLRAECLNESWFLSLEDAREKIEGWRWHYNGERPHSALGNLAPETFALVATAGVQWGNTEALHRQGGGVPLGCGGGAHQNHREHRHGLSKYPAGPDALPRTSYTGGRRLRVPGGL